MPQAKCLPWEFWGSGRAGTGVANGLIYAIAAISLSLAT